MVIYQGQNQAKDDRTNLSRWRDFQRRGATAMPRSEPPWVPSLTGGTTTQSWRGLLDVLGIGRCRSA